VWDSARNRAVLFGGFDEATGRRNDTWEWDSATTTWIDRTPSGTKPSPRHSGLIAYDSTRGKTILFSGNTGTGVATAGTWSSDTWEWDGTAGTWTLITAPTISGTQYNSGTTMVYDPGINKIVLYYYYNQIWTYTAGTGATGTWADAAPVPTKMDTAVPGYVEPAMVYDSGQQRVVVFGGQYYGRALWELKTDDFTWVNRSAPANGPIQRQSPSLAFDSKAGKLMVFGGRSSVDSQFKQDIWEWSGIDSTLTPRTTGGIKPDPRNQAAMTYDSLRDRLLLFGGTGTTTYDDLWSWSSMTREWTQISVSGTRPSARYGIWMFYDATRDKVYVFGAYSGGNQIWEYDPALNSWRDRTVTAPPAGVTRSYFDVAFDSNRGKIVMLGGTSGGAYNTDIWEWDTTTGVWAQLMPAAGSPIPDARHYHTMVYDSVRRVIVLFGGYHDVTGFNAPGNDSWEWDANLLRWSETTPTGVKPAPRYSHAMAFNSVRGSTYVFGGTVPEDTAYGPSEFWEYMPNATARPNGAGCTVATEATACVSKHCVDGVCCAQTAAECAGTCKSCNVAGMTGTCANVPAGQPDETCPSDQACDAAQACKKRLGQACNAFNECATGNCVDGVCCDTACNDRCKQCNLAAKRGTCSFVPSGDEDPTGVPACVSEPDQGRFCDGAGNCNNMAKAAGKPCTAGGQCLSTFCIDGYCCNSGCAQTCYQCDKAGALGTCSPMAAGAQDRSATTPCDTSMQYCSASATCLTNKKPNGQTCTASTDCGSNNCVDGICCSGTCTGTCQSCAVPGSLGSCVNLPAGSQDSMATTPCSGTSYCDAAGTCQTGLKPNGSVCTAGSECGSNKCVDNVCCNATCTEACYTCNLAGGTPGECVGLPTGATDPACPGANFCDAMHRCTSGKKPNGGTCTTDTECASNACVDGTCCESACTGNCRSCKNATGTCTLAADGTDPREQCKGTGVCTGTCNGQGACRWGPQGTTCSQAGCQSDGYIRDVGKCDGAGNCVAPQTRDCMGFACYTDPVDQMAKCKNSCFNDPDCAQKRYCLDPNDGGAGGAGGAGATGGGDSGTGSQCPPAFPLGHACTRNTQCLSNTCSDGVCCNLNCDKCGSCNTPGMEGTCIPIPAGTDPEKECMDNASDPSGMCKGFCSGQARCTYPAAGITCGTCKTCNGSGLCNVKPDDDTTCGTIECDGLDTSCLNYNDLTTRRCASLGACKAPNTIASCTDVSNLCTGGGGSGGAGGSGSGGRGGSTGADASTDGGGGGGGGGGCCQVGGGPTPDGMVALLVLGLAFVSRRRRR
jgi:MYXO-CTERM domain-containing protein